MIVCVDSGIDTVLYFLLLYFLAYHFLFTNVLNSYQYISSSYKYILMPKTCQIHTGMLSFTQISIPACGLGYTSNPGSSFAPALNL